MSVYILHFDPPYKHARHYVGFSTQPLRRVAHHAKGTGARLPAVAMKAGCRMELGRVFTGKDRSFERELKLRRYGPLEGLCGTCLGDRPRKRLATLRRETRYRYPKRKKSTLEIAFRAIFPEGVLTCQ